jgi:hypothetical protein
MKDASEYLEALARRARQERAPQGDISRRILARLPEPGSVMRTPLLVFASGYAAVASVALVYGYFLLGAMSNPLLSLFQQAMVMTP